MNFGYDDGDSMNHGFLKDILHKDLDGLEAGLDVLSRAVARNAARLKEKEEGLVSYVQSGSTTYALSFHQFAQNLAVSEQILMSNGMDASVDLLALNKLALSSSFDDSPLKAVAAKSVLNSVTQAWDEYVRRRHAQLTAKEDLAIPIPLPTAANAIQALHTHLAARMNLAGQKVLVFLQEDVDILDQVFKEIGPLPTLVNTLYHKFYTRQIATILSHPHQSPHFVLDWDTWQSLCTEVKKDVTVFTREAGKKCGIFSATEFEHYFPLLPTFHEVSRTASELLAGKIMRTFSTVLAQEREAFNLNKTYPISHIPSRSNFQSYTLITENLIRRRELQVSPPIALSASTIIRELDTTVDFVACPEFRPLIDSFTRSLLAPTLMYISRLGLAARDVPQTNDLDFLYISTNSASALHERLVIYEHILTPAYGSYYASQAPSLSPPPSTSPSPPSSFASSPPSSFASPSPPSSFASPRNSLTLPSSSNTQLILEPLRKNFLSPSSANQSGATSTRSTNGSPSHIPALSALWECQKLLEGVANKQIDQLASIFVDVCSTYIFPNIDQNEWQDHRGFYFDSRPSHGIQMVHFYLKAQSRLLHHDLHPQCVQSVIALATQRCAELLLARYQTIAPSRMRSIHFRLDLTYLVAAIQTLQTACGAWYNKLGLGSLCGTLLGVMAVVVGPLSTLCSFLQRYQKQQQKTFHLPSPASLVPQRPDPGLPNLAADLWRNAEDPVRADVLPLEDSQFLTDKHTTLSTYPFNYDALLDTCCSEFPRSFLVQLVNNRPELKENIYPPLSDEDKQLLPLLQEFLRPP